MNLSQRNKHQGEHTPAGDFWARATHILLLFLVFIICVWYPSAVHAQDEGELLIQPPITDDFPVLSLRFTPRYGIENAGSVLAIDQVHIYEDEQEVEVLSLDQRSIGVHFTLALNGSSELDHHDSNGISHYDKLRSVLSSWALERTSAPKDAWSFSANEGIIVRNLTSKNAWVDALESYQPQFRSLEPDLVSLESALVLIKNRVVTFGMDKVLLYITQAPKPEQIQRIRELSEEARQASIQVHVWMISDPYFLTNDQGKSLIELASNTGGQFFNFTGEEVIPDPETYLGSTGYIYNLTYQSEVRETGTYPLRIEVELPDRNLKGEGPPFFLQVSPPNPILLSPPCEITRSYLLEDNLDEAALFPDWLRVDFMVEFPDQFPREIIASRLYIDGSLADERTEPPFNSLTWDLSDLTVSGEHTIQIEVEDQLGLFGRTIQMPIQLTVVKPEVQASFPEKWAGLIFAGTLFLIAFLLFLRWAVKEFGAKRADAHRSSPVGQEPGELYSYTINHKKKTQAILIPLEITAGHGTVGVKHITQDVMTIGCDPLRADLALDSPGVDDIQAQIACEFGSFWLKDLGSTSGTWVNYTQIGTEPEKLHTGDLIHFGDLGFRFRALGYARQGVVTIENYEPIL